MGVLWLLGVELLPDLHLAFHDDRDHTHAADGTIVRVEHERGHGHGRGHGHSHAHDSGHGHGHSHSLDAAPEAGVPRAVVGPRSDQHPRPIVEPVSRAEAPRAALGTPPHADASADDAQPAIDNQRGSDHAASGIAHHAIALHRPPPPLLEPLAVLRAAWRVELASDDQISHAPLARPTARGPPAAG
jgi:hypothetical protein